MKKLLLIILFLVVGSGMMISQQSVLTKNVYIQPDSITIESLLEAISIQTGVLFSYSSQQINAKRLIKTQAGNKSIGERLTNLAKKYQIAYVLMENQIVLKKRGKKEHLEFDQRLYSISGYLYDSASGETLIGATVIVSGSPYGSITNAFGYYSLSLPEGKYLLEFSYIAFEKKKLSISLRDDITQSVYLQPSRFVLPAVLIKTDLQRELISESQMSRLDVKTEQLEEMPEFGGEVGLIKGLQTLPGIKSHSDGSAFFFVRGGAKDQNLIIIDDAPIYNPSHLFGYYSMVIPDFTKDIKVYKGDMPVHLGDRLSSIIEIRTKDGNLNNFHLTGMLNPLVTRFSVEGPIVKGKSSFFTSYRRSNFKWIYNRYLPSLDFYFSDFNLKWNYAANNRNRFFFTYFYGSDLMANNISENNQSGITWNNMASSVRWNHVINNTLFVNTIFLASLYQYRLFLNETNWRSNIANISLKSDFNYYPRPDLKFKFGYNISNHVFDPGSLTLSGSTQIFPSITFGKSKEYALYGKIEHKLNERFSYSLGLRMPVWSNTGPTILYLYDDNYQLKDTVHIANNKTYKTFINLDPRLSLKYKIDYRSSFKFSYGAYHQYIHLLSNTTSPFTSMEVWLPSGVNIKPQRADMFALGYVKYFSKNKFHLNVELYYKFMQNQIDYEPHANMLLNPLVEGELRFGKARAYGLEALLEKKHGRLNGWLSYTWSRVLRKTKDINDGRWYPAYRDRPHDFSVFINYRVGKRFYVSANWTYYTGSAISSPTGFYKFNDYTIPIYGEKNNDRLPDYHRLDLSLRYVFNKTSSRYKHSLNFSLYNAYGNRNPISINYNKINKKGALLIPSDLFGVEELVFTQRDLLRIMPSISYKFEL